MVSSSRNRGPLWAVACALLLIGVPIVAGEDIGPVKQDDAGSGQDAPDDISEDLTIEPEVVYEGMSTGPAFDRYDIYHLVGQEGQVFEGWADGSLGCYRLLHAQGTPLDGTACSYEHAPINTGPLVVALPYTGDYYLRILNSAPAVYTFAYNLSGDAPDVRTLPITILKEGDDPPTPAEPVPLAIPEGCDGEFIYVSGDFGDRPKFTDDCYHMRTGLNHLDTSTIDVLIVPPISTYPERDLRVMRQAVEMWAEGIDTLAPEMGMAWLSDGVTFDIFVDDDRLSTDPLWDPEIVVVATNPVGGIGIGVDPLDFLFGMKGPCHGQPNPLAGMDDWEALEGFDTHHDGQSGTYAAECEGGGSVCFAVNGAIDPAPGYIDFFGLYDLVAHEVGHCLTIGHVGDAADHKANAVPEADIMAYTDQPHDKCVSTLDVESFALTMSRFLLDPPLAANDGESDARGSFQIQHPDNHSYASPTGRAEDCPQPDAGLVPGGSPVDSPTNDDAGSGQDAPNEVSQAITIQPDIVYQGTSPGPVVDTIDVYHLEGQAGQVFEGSSDGNLGCYHLLDEQGDRVGDHACAYAHAFNTGPIIVELPYTGDYYFKVTHLAPAVYHFGFSLDGDAPPVGLLDQL